MIIGSGEAVVSKIRRLCLSSPRTGAFTGRTLSPEYSSPCAPLFPRPQRFHGTIENWQLGQISLSRFHSAPVCYDRARQHLRGRPEDDLLITFATKSDTRNSVKATTSFTAARTVSSSNAAIFRINSRTRKTMSSGFLKNPIQMLKNRIRVLDRYVSYIYNSSRGAGALFLDTARTIPRRMDQFGAIAREGLGHCLVELLCLALEDDERALGSGMSSVRLGRLARIERYVRKNLANHAMTIEEIALANGISSRYLHELFRGGDRTIGQWIRTLRLEAALADLQDPRHGETVAEIAYRWGFGDQAQFSRHFKSHFGKTPRGIRPNSLRTVNENRGLAKFTEDLTEIRRAGGRAPEASFPAPGVRLVRLTLLRRRTPRELPPEAPRTAQFPAIPIFVYLRKSPALVFEGRPKCILTTYALCIFAAR